MNPHLEQMKRQQQRLSIESINSAKKLIEQAENPHPLTDHKAVVEAKSKLQYMPYELYLKAKGVDL